MEVAEPSFKDLGIMECEVDPWKGEPLTDAPETLVLVASEGPPEPGQWFEFGPDAVSAVGLIGADRIAIAQGSQVTIRNAADFEDPVRLEYDGPLGVPRIVALVGDGDVVFAGHKSERITAWDLAASAEGTTVLCRPDDGVIYYDHHSMDELTWLGGGRVVGGFDDLVLVWRGRDLAHPVVTKCTSPTKYTPIIIWVTSLAQDRILFGTASGDVFEWDGVQPSAQLFAESHRRMISAVAIGDGRVASYDFDQTVRVWDPRAPLDGTILDTMSERVVKLVPLAPNLLVVVVRRDGGKWRLTVWDLANYARVRTFTLNAMSRLAPGPGGTLLAACGWGWMILDPLA